MSTPPPIHNAPNAPVEDPRRPVPAYLAWSIIATCSRSACAASSARSRASWRSCSPRKVNSALERGDYAAAQRASSNAKLWCWITTGLNIVGLLWTVFAISTGRRGDMMEQFEAMQAMQGV